METVFHISNCPKKYQVKYATCTLLNSALTWWKSHKRTIGADAAFAMSWRELMKLMAKVYCPSTKIQKMESKLWNLTVKNNDLDAYTQRFQELTMFHGGGATSGGKRRGWSRGSDKGGGCGRVDGDDDGVVRRLGRWRLSGDRGG
ncbi:reverse transcriptase domain-containing protein [Tanacetum coccineum]